MKKAKEYWKSFDEEKPEDFDIDEFYSELNQARLSDEELKQNAEDWLEGRGHAEAHGTNLAGNYGG